MNVGATLEAGAQLAEGRQPGVSALDHPAVAPEPIIAFDASAGDAILDPAAFEMGTASRVVVTLAVASLAAARSSPIKAPSSCACTDTPCWRTTIILSGALTRRVCYPS